MDRRARWEQRTTWPLIVLGLGFVVAYSVYILWDHEPAAVALSLLLVIFLSWIAFIVDVVVRIALTPRGQRWAFIRSHPVDVLSALLPVFRGLKVVDLLRGLPYFHVRSAAAIRVEIAAYALCYVVVFVYFISLATYDVERTAEGATILTFGDAIWWAAVSISTVGYGDVYPVTGWGRFNAVLLIFSGVLLIGIASGVAASYVLERTRNLGRPAEHIAEPAPQAEGTTSPDS